MHKEELEKHFQTLRNGTPLERKRAVQELHIFGEEAGDLLIFALKDRDMGVRDAAFHVISSHPSEALAEHLVTLLGYKNIEVRNLASELLIRFGSLAIRPLIKVLREGNKDERKFAADILGLVGDSRVIPHLEAALDDPEPNVAVSAAEALGNLGAVRSIPKLIQHFHSCTGMEPVVIDALGKLSDPAADRFLLQVLQSGDENLAVIALEALSKSKSLETAKQIASLLPQFSDLLLNEAIKAIICIVGRHDQKLEAFLDLKKYRKQIFEILQLSEDHETLLRVFEQIPAEILNECLPKLFDLLEHQSEDIRYFVAGRLSKVDRKRLIEIGLQKIEELSSEAQTVLLSGLQSIPAAEILPLLEKLAASSETSIRVQVAPFLATLKHPRARRILERFAHDADLSVQEAAYSILSYEPEAVHIPLFKEGLRSKSANIVESSILALTVLDPAYLKQEFRTWSKNGKDQHLLCVLRHFNQLASVLDFETVCSLMEHSNPEVRAAAVRALQLFDGERIQPLLKKRLQDKSREVRLAAIQVSLSLFPDQSQTILQQALQDHDFWIQNRALETIVKLKQVDLVPHIFPLLKSSDRFVQIRAIQAILTLAGESAEDSLISYLDAIGEDAWKLISLAKEESNVTI